MSYEPKHHVPNNSMGGRRATDEHFFGARGMIPVAGLADLAATPHGTVTVPPSFTGTIAEVQALIDALTDLINDDRTAFNLLKQLLRNNV